MRIKRRTTQAKLIESNPESFGGDPARMILTVSDPDAMFAQAVAAGAREVVAVEEAYRCFEAAEVSNLMNRHLIREPM